MQQTLPNTSPPPIANGTLPSPAAQPSPQEMLLSQMSDVVAPEPVGLWPLAPGWWLLIILGLFAVIMAAVTYWRWHRSRRYRRQALAELNWVDNTASESSDLEYAQSLNNLLKKTALAAYPHSRDRLAGLYGKNWGRFLQLCLNKAPANLPDPSWVEAIYQPQFIDSAGGQANQLDNLRGYARFWIKRHKHMNQAQLRSLLEAENSIPKSISNSAPASAITAQTVQVQEAHNV